MKIPNGNIFTQNRYKLYMIRYYIQILFTHIYMKKPALIEVDKLIGMKVEPYRTSYSDK